MKEKIQDLHCVTMDSISRWLHLPDHIGALKLFGVPLQAVSWPTHEAGKGCWVRSTGPWATQSPGLGRAQPSSITGVRLGPAEAQQGTPGRSSVPVGPGKVTREEPGLKPEWHVSSARPSISVCRVTLCFLLQPGSTPEGRVTAAPWSWCVLWGQSDKDLSNTWLITGLRSQVQPTQKAALWSTSSLLETRNQ